MQTPNIVPVTTSSHGVGNTVKEASLVARPPPSGTYLDAAENYEVRVERIYCPVNSGLMPIDPNTSGYQINLYCDVKTPPDPAIPGLVYGNNFFSLTGEIFSVEDGLAKLNTFLGQWGLGSFVLNASTELIEFHTTSRTIHSKVWIYLEARLADMLQMQYEPVKIINDVSYYRMGFKYSTADNFVEIQKRFTQNRFYRIQNIRLYTDLPSYYVEAHDTTQTTFESTMLHQVSYNSSSMSEVIDVLYLPSDRYMRSLLSTDSIKTIVCRLTYQYEDGSEIPVRLFGWQSTYITLCFERIHKI
jgi:hypothetical protein